MAFMRRRENGRSSGSGRELWRRLACGVLCLVLLSSNLTVAFATEGSTATAAVEQSEASYTLVLTHHFQDGTENGLKVEEMVTLTGADFPEGVCGLSRFAHTYEQAAAEQPGSVSLNSFAQGKAAAEIVYTVQEGLTAGLDDNGAVVFQAAAQEPEPDPEPVDPQPEPEPEQHEVITYTLTLTCRFTDAAGKVVDMPQTVTLTGADFTDNGYSVTAPQYDHAAANSPSVTISLDSFDAHHKAAVTIAYTVQEGWTVSAGEDGGVTFAEVTQPQEEDSLMLALTHEFYQNGECVASTYSLHELTAGDFNGEGVLSTTSFAEKSDKITLTSAPSLSMEEAEDGYLVGTLCYEVKAGWKMVLKENAASGRDDGISLFSEFQGGGKFDDYEFVAADVVTVKLQFKYSNTGGLAGVDASAPQTVELQATKKADGSYELSAYDLPTVNGFRIVLNPGELNKYVVSPPTGKETPEQLKQKLENGDFNVDVDKYTIYYRQEVAGVETHPTYQNIYSTIYNEAWDSARRLEASDFTAEATGSNDKKGATPLTDPSLHITLTEAQFKSAVTNGLDITVYYRRNATWYTVNHWVPEGLVVGGVPAGAEKKTEDGTVYVRLDQETIQGRVGANTAAKAKVGGKYELVSAVPFNQVQIANTNTVVDIYYASASSYRIIFNTDYTYIPRQQVNMGSPVDFTKVTSPQRAGYTFGGWRYLKKDATPDSDTGEYADTDYEMAETNGQPGLTVDETLIANAKLVASGDVMAIHLYPKWVPDTTTVRVILWTEDLAGGYEDVQAVANGGTTAYYDAKYAGYEAPPVTNKPDPKGSNPDYSNVGSFKVTVDTDLPLLENDATLLNSIQTKVESEFKTAMGQASGIDVANFYTQADFGIVHEEEGEINYNATKASADGKTTIYVYFTRNVYELMFTYYGAATVDGTNSSYCVATSTNGYSFSSGAAVPGGTLDFGYSASHGGGNGTNYNNGWMRADVTSDGQMPVPKTITIRAKYGADLRDVWPVARSGESVVSPDNPGNRGTTATMISWATTDGKYNEGGFFNSGLYNAGEPTIMGTYAAMSAEIVADPLDVNLPHNLVAYWFNGNISHYRNNHCYEVPELDVTGLQRVSIYNNDTTDEKNFLYLVPKDNAAIAKYDDLMRVSNADGKITYNDPNGDYYAVRAYDGSYYAVARQVDTVSSNTIAKQNPSARLHMTRANVTADHSTQYADTDGAYNGTTVGTGVAPYDLYFYYNRDRYTITYMAPSSNTSVTAANEVTLGTIELPYGAQVTPGNYGFKLDYKTKNTDAAYTSGAYAWRPAAETAVCPDRAENGTAAWTFKGWALGPGGVNMLWNNENGNMTGETLAAEGNLRLYAIWDAPTYMVTFHLNGGNVDGNSNNIVENVEANTRYTANGQIPRPLWEGHTLVGWYNANANGEMVDAQGDVTTDVAQAVAFDFDRAVSSDLHAVAFWNANTTEKFKYTVYHVTLSLKEGDNRTEKVSILNDEIVGTGGTEYYLLETDEYTDQDYIQNGTLNLSSVKIDGYVPQTTNKSLVMSKGADGVYNVIFYYDPVVSHSYTVRFVRAGKENSATGADIVLKQENIQADSVVVTPRSAQATELTNKGYRLVVRHAANTYTPVETAENVKWYTENGREMDVKTLTGDAIPDTITYLVEPIPYTITYQNATGSPVAATGALNAVTAAAGTSVGEVTAGLNPTKYTVVDHFTATNPGPTVFDADTTKWYQFTGWTLGEKTQDKDAAATGPYNPLEVDKGTRGNLTFVANWAAVTDLGSLTVRKTVAGNAGEATKEFHFTVTLGDTSITGTFGTGDTSMTFIDGVASFTLAHGESKTATGLLEGLDYIVTETDGNQGGYVTTVNGVAGTSANGRITNTASTAAFTNTRNVGSLTVSKTVTGYAVHTDKAFTFTVTLSDTSVAGTFGTGDTSMTFTGGVARFTLKHGESKVAVGLPSGVTYTVEEKPEAGYTCNPLNNQVTGAFNAANNYAATAAFTNTYSLTPLEVTAADLGINGTKTLDGREFQTGDTFRFEVTRTGNAPADEPLPDQAACEIQPASGSTEDIAFGSFTFTKPGVYRYRISEVIPQGQNGNDPLPGVTYDTTAYRLIVTVADNGDGTLSVSHVQIQRSPRAEGSNWVDVYNSATAPTQPYCNFTNTYSAGELNLSLTGRKVLENKNLTDYADEQFRFILTAGDADTPMPNGKKGGTSVFHNNETGGIVVPSVRFTTADSGKVYNYTITEYQPTTDGSLNGTGLDGAQKNGEGKWVYQGVTYDTHVHTVEVTVSTVLDGSGQPVIAVSVVHDKDHDATGAMSSFVFTNTYNAVSAPLPLAGTKNISGREFQNGDQFTFQIAPLNGAPAPTDAQGAPVTQAVLAVASGREAPIDFGTLRFTAEDMKDAQGVPVTEKTFQYEITEIQGDLTDMVYDTAKRTVEVRVTDNGGVLNAQLVTDGGDLVWNNRFIARSTLTVAKTVAGKGGDKQKEFHFTVTLTDANGGPVSGDFGPLRFTLKHGQEQVLSGIPVGTSYTVVEAEANQNGYVTVATGDGKGTIQENGSVVDFTNTRDIKPGNLTVTKTVTGLKGDKTKAFTFVVTLDDETINGTYGEMEFVNGRAEFTLKHGERKTAEGLPAGVAYTVKEGDNAGYTVRKTGDTGVIREGRTAYARFTNRRTNLDGQPQTGDETRLGLWAGLSALCLLGAAVSLAVSRKRRGKFTK